MSIMTHDFRVRPIQRRRVGKISRKTVVLRPECLSSDKLKNGTSFIVYHRVITAQPFSPEVGLTAGE